MARNLHRATRDLSQTQLEAARQILRGYRGRVSGGHSLHSYRGDTDFNRVVFLCEGRKVAVDFLPHGRTPFRIAELQDGQRVATRKITEASGVSGFVNNLLGKQKAAAKDAAVEPELPVLKSDAYAKDILRGSDVFKDAERKIRLFLRGAGGLGKQQLFVLYGQAGVGKAQFVDTPLLTPTGWIKMGDVKVGDAVIGSDGRPTKVIGVFPQGKKEVFRVEFNNLDTTECCDDHLWTVKDRQAGALGWKVLPLKEMRKNFLNATRQGKVSRFQVPVVAPIEFETTIEESKQIDPYTLGVLIGDGSLSQTTVNFTTFDQFIHDRVHSYISTTFPGVSVKPGQTGAFRISRDTMQLPKNPVKTILESLGLMRHLSTDKFIPHEYLYGPLPGRIALLQGLMDTDGSVWLRRNRRTISLAFATSSYQLHKDFIQLIHGLGGHCTVSEKFPSYRNSAGDKIRSENLHYTIGVNLPASVIPFSLPRKRDLYLNYFAGQNNPIRKITNIYATGEIKDALCIRVEAEDSLYVTENYILTHNSVAAREALLAECGAETSSAEIHKRLKQSIAFDPEDFKVRMAANQARDQARNLYTRYLHNYTLSRKEDALVPETDADLKNKALEKVKEILKDQLYGYELTLDDVEGHGTRVKKTASDPVEKLKKLSGDDAKQPYHQANGWTEAPNEMSNEDLYFQCYVSNAATTFIDEGDYFLSKSNPLMKIVTDNKQFRRLSSGSKSGFAEINGFILPDSFWYSGRMVITTNLTPRDFDDAIRTRSASYGLYLSLDQLFDRLRDILPKIQSNDLPHLPPVVLTGIRNILKKFSDQGELKQFDFRTFVLLADEYALMIEDTVKEARAENPEFPEFSPYVQKDETLDAADERFRNWRQTPEGQQIAQRVGKKFRKIILNQIQAMNRAHDRDANIVELKPKADEEAA